VKYFEKKKVDVPQSRSEKLLDGIGYSIFLGSILTLVFLWTSLPDQVPGHYNFAGQVTRWDSKGALLIIPFLGLLNGLVMQGLERFPEIYRYPERYNEENAPQFVLTTRQMMNRVKNILLVFFGLSIFQDLSLSLDWGFRLGAWDFPLLMLALALIFIIGFRSLKRIR